MNSSDFTFFTDLQLAERWHLHRKTLIRWRTSNTGPAFVKINGRVLYPLAEVEQYEKANTIIPDNK
jgi:hypothetical protein